MPDPATCLELLERHGAYPNIVEHCRVVSRVALQVAEARNRIGAGLDLAVIQAAALLHDVGKVLELESQGRINHAQEGARILEQEGWPELARIVGNHLIQHYVAGGLPEPDRVVNYADKRVIHHRIVPLDRRLAYIRERYPQVEPDLIRAYRLIEGELLDGTDLIPETIGTARPTRL